MNTVPKIVDTGLEWSDAELDERSYTDKIVIHHTGDNGNNGDYSAEDIHEMHKNLGWAGIGYHFVIRKDGTIEVGRPCEMVGAHAYGFNGTTIGIMVSGDFTEANPTKRQIESLAHLIAYLAEEYGITIDEWSVIAHRDLMATECCGEQLYKKLNTVRGKAIWYQENS